MKSNIYTRTGDRGTTSLVDGSRRPKDDGRIDAYGTIDELNSWVGNARGFCADPLLDRILEFLQHRFYNCSSILAAPPDFERGVPLVFPEDVSWIETAINKLEAKTGALTGFVVPGGTRAAGILHIARTVCRRAERRMWALAQKEPVDETVLKFANRASDLLFAAARYANVVEKKGDVMWQKELEPPSLED